METKEKLFLYEETAAKIESSIKQLQLQPGDKIASVRKISTEFHVSVNTVFQAYAILEAKGIIYSKPKSGYFISMSPKSAIISLKKNDLTLPTIVDITAMSAVMMKKAKEKEIVNFSILAPVNEHLPITKLNKYVTSSLYEISNDNYQYHLVDGHPALIKQLALKTFDWPNSISQDKILVTNGCMEAINLCLDAITKPGDIVAIESPTYHGILQSLEQRGLQALEIGVNPETGLCLDDLKEGLKKNKVAACIFMPNCHNPVGCKMPEANKIELVNLLGGLDIPLIEDDALGELSFHSAVFPAKAYDKYNNVLYCSSFSKTLAPGFRIGWVSGGKYHHAIEKLKYGSNMSTNSVLQAAIGKYLESGQYNKHIRKMRNALQSQMLKYLSTISEIFPAGTKLAIPQGGLSIWIELPPKIDAYALQKEALNKGVGICPGHIFSTSDFFHHYIRINYCPLWNHKTEKAINTLAKVLQRLT
ncbi:PLP-dependent aminotransferase family protein [Flavobacterium soyae]|uniref:PLP-dependent aminotransferase family protein n=1 Tax=Flavobacterium soyae TaxID=2903098 RepID=A0ABZ2UHR2_9FLAO|nr:PLP-dependent aminotransferase family protein [Flavobacterium soyae]MCD9573684.1 PLP-dependent aminotransferase family protein [Flavobacterium soyae]